MPQQFPTRAKVIWWHLPSLQTEGSDSEISSPCGQPGPLSNTVLPHECPCQRLQQGARVWQTARPCYSSICRSTQNRYVQYRLKIYLWWVATGVTWINFKKCVGRTKTECVCVCVCVIIWLLCAGESVSVLKQTEEIADPRAVNQDKTNMLFSVMQCYCTFQAYRLVHVLLRCYCTCYMYKVQPKITQHLKMWLRSDDCIFAFVDEAGYVFGSVCLFVCFSAGFWMDFDEIFDWLGYWGWLKEQMIRFWQRSGFLCESWIIFQLPYR